MRKLIIAVLVLISLESFAQPTNYTWYKQRIRQYSLMLDSMLYIPRYNGTPSGVRANENSAIDGAIAVDTANGRQYFYYNGSWRRLANYSELGVDSIWREAGKDSIFYSKAGSTYKIKDSTGGGGSADISETAYFSQFTADKYTINFKDNSFSDSTLLNNLQSSTVWNDGSGLIVNSAYSGSLTLSNLKAHDYGINVSSEYTQRLVFKVMDSTTTVNIGIGTDNSQSLSSTTTMLYISGTVGAYPFYLVNWCNSSFTAIDSISISVGDVIELVLESRNDTTIAKYRNLTTNKYLEIKRGLASSSSSAIPRNGYPSIFIKSGHFKLLEYNFSIPDFQYAFIGNSITAGNNASKFDTSHVYRLIRKAPSKVSVLASPSATTNDYLSSSSQVLKLRNKVIFLDGLMGNDAQASLNYDTSKARYSRLVSALKANGNTVIHIDITYRTTFMGSESWPHFYALNKWLDTAYGSVDRVVHLDTIVGANLSDGVHPNDAGHTVMYNSILRNLPEYFGQTEATTAEISRIYNPYKGQQIFNTDSSKIVYWDGSGWVTVGGSGGGSPGGVNKKIQYNSSGSFAGAGNMTREMGASEYLQLEEQSFSYGNDPLLKIRASYGLIGLKLEGFASHTPVIQLTDAGGYDYRIGGLNDGSFNFFEMGSYSSRINLGVYGGTKRFSVQARADAPSGNSVEIFSGTAGSTGLVITGASGQTANLLEIKNSTPSNLAVITATGSFDLYNGTAPTSSVTNGIRLYSEDVTASAELKVRDEAGNITTLSPHNFGKIPGGRSEKLAWSFYSQRNGEYITADMTKALRTIENQSSEIEELKRQVAELKGLIYEMKAPVKLIHTGKVK